MLLAVGEHVLEDFPRDSVRWVTALAGGLGCGHEEMCGALSGGAVVIGALYGRARPGINDKLAQELARRYRDAFLVEYGCTQCAAVRERIRGEDGESRCAELVEWAAGVLLDLLADVPPDGQPAAGR